MTTLGFIVVVVALGFFLKFCKGILTGDLNSGYLVDLVGVVVLVKGALVVKLCWTLF